MSKEHKRRISFHFPTRTPVDQEDGSTKWLPASHKVGRVRPDGSIDNCRARCDPNKIRGGIAYTENTVMEMVDEDTLRNPATNEKFRRCKSGNGFWGKESKTWIANAYIEFSSDELGGVK